MREMERQKFLDRNGFGGLDCPLLAGDASFRKYYRLQKDGVDYVLMDAPPDKEKVEPFINIAKYLKSHGFSAPDIIVEDVKEGFLLLEDLGDDTYTRLLAAGESERDLYRLATDVLIELQKDIPDLPDDLPKYDEDLLRVEADLFVDWWAKAALGDDFVSDELKKSYQQAWEKPFEMLEDVDQKLVLRDYHVDNMLYLPKRDSFAQCGLLDFQDAVLGPGIYDLVSLLEDARRDVSAGVIEEMKMRYNSAFKSLDTEDFKAQFAILGAQRHAKVIGIFVRLCLRDKKPDYLHHIPRVWRLFERALRHPVLSDVKAWVDEHVNEDKRGIPSCLMHLSNRE